MSDTLEAIKALADQGDAARREIKQKERQAFAQREMAEQRMLKMAQELLPAALREYLSWRGLGRYRLSEYTVEHYPTFSLTVPDWASVLVSLYCPELGRMSAYSTDEPRWQDDLANLNRLQWPADAARIKDAVKAFRVLVPVVELDETVGDWFVRAQTEAGQRTDDLSEALSYAREQGPAWSAAEQRAEQNNDEVLARDKISRDLEQEPVRTIEQAILDDFEDWEGAGDHKRLQGLVAYTMVGILAELKRGRYAHDGD